MPTRDGVPAPSRRGLCAWYQGLLWTAAGVWWPFLFPLVAGRGVGFARLGLLVAVWPATALLAQPLAGWLCDRSGRTRVVQCLLSLGAAAVLPLFGIVSGLAPELAVVVAFALLNAPSVPLADALTVAQLQKVGGDYGGVRLWGSAGFAVAGIAAGLAVHLGWIQPSGLLVVGAVLTVPVALLALAFPADVRGLAPRAPAGAVLQARPLLTLLGLFALVLVPMNAHSTYFSLYLAHLGGGAVFQGAGWALPALVEVPFFLWGPRVQRRLGVRRTLVIAFACQGLSLAAVALAGSPLAATAGALLQGPAFALFYGAAVPAVDRLAPPGLRASGQALLWASCFGAGSVAANLGAAWGAAALGPAGLYRAMAGWSLAATLVFALLAPRTDPQGAEAGGI